MADRSLDASLSASYALCLLQRWAVGSVGGDAKLMFAVFVLIHVGSSTSLEVGFPFL